jgi:spore coat polysaccharide biosynthesis protein SpsF (cytidylyltransferase family)
MEPSEGYNDMTNGVVIQARMTSSRFPGKSMAMLAGKPVLQHVIERCQMIPFINKVVVAMPVAKESDPMGALCDTMGVETFFGPEHDVLKRYYLAATYYEFTTIMRITADCPFLDPIVCGEVLSLLKAEQLDYCCNCYPVRTYPKGLDCEAFTYDCLEAAHVTTKSQHNREHVTPWMQTRKGIRRACVQQKIDVSNQNWCVDYPEDISRLEALLADAQKRYDAEHIQPGLPGRPFTTDELLKMESQRGSPN